MSGKERYRPENDPTKSETFNRRSDVYRQVDDDGRKTDREGNREADADYFGNLKKFNGSRCGTDQRGEPTRHLRDPKK